MIKERPDISMKHVDLENIEGVTGISRSFESNPAMALPSGEIIDFLTRLKSRKPQETQNFIDFVCQSNGFKELVQASPIAIIVTPALHEKTNFPAFSKTVNSLAAFLPNKIGLVFFDNIKNGENFDDLPIGSLEIPTLHIQRVFNPNEVCIGRVRFEASTATLIALSKMQSNDNRLLIFLDGDTQGLRNPQNIDRIIESFQRQPQLDIVVDWWTHPQECFEKFPLLSIVHNFTRNFQLAREENDVGFDMNHSSGGPVNITSFGFSTIMRASSFSAVGGFNENAFGNEDVAIAMTLADLRKDHLDKHMRYTSQLDHDHNMGIGIEVDPRRLLWLMAQGMGYGEIHTGDKEEIFQSWINLGINKPRNWKEVDEFFSNEEQERLINPTKELIEFQLNDIVKNYFFLPQIVPKENWPIAQNLLSKALKTALKSTNFTGIINENLTIQVKKRGCKLQI